MTAAEEERARAVKACRLADLLTHVRSRCAVLTHDVLAGASQTEREAYASAAGVRVPSERTWALVIAILADREAHSRRSTDFVGVAIAEATADKTGGE